LSIAVQPERVQTDAVSDRGFEDARANEFTVMLDGFGEREVEGEEFHHVPMTCPVCYPLRSQSLAFSKKIE
jgi:hypothetical protein